MTRCIGCFVRQITARSRGGDVMAGEIKIIDNATPWLKGMAAGAPEWKRKALKSAGWMMQKEIKAGIRSGAPGGRRYTKGLPADKRKMLEKMLGNKGKSKYPMMGRLVNAVGYQYKDGRVVVGWLSASAVNIGTKQELGLIRQVTDNMRYAFWAAGIPISRDRSTIAIPARPTFAPMRTVLEPKVMPWVEAKIIEYANSGAPISKGGGSRYKVY